jgi:hypothetical protein
MTCVEQRGLSGEGEAGPLISSLRDFRFPAPEYHGLTSMATTFQHYAIAKHLIFRWL